MLNLCNIDLSILKNYYRRALTQGANGQSPNRASITKYKNVLRAWSSTRTPWEIEKKLESDVASLEARGLETTNTVVENVQFQVMLALERLTEYFFVQNMKGLNEQVFLSQSDAEHFIRRVVMELNESLSNMKRDFVSEVRTRAIEFLKEHFTSLEKKIQALRKDDLQDEFIYELQDRRDSIERLVFSLIRSRTLAKFATKDDAQGKLYSIRVQIAQLIEGQKAIDTSTQADDGCNMRADELTTWIERLGFMRQAPKAESLPFLPRSRLFMQRVSELPSRNRIPA
jgi:hypothetical protein